MGSSGVRAGGCRDDVRVRYLRLEDRSRDSGGPGLLVASRRLSPAERWPFVLHGHVRLTRREIAAIVGRKPAAPVKAREQSQQARPRSRRTPRRTRTARERSTPSWPRHREANSSSWSDARPRRRLPLQGGHDSPSRVPGQARRRSPGNHRRAPRSPLGPPAIVRSGALVKRSGHLVAVANVVVSGEQDTRSTSSSIRKNSASYRQPGPGPALRQPVRTREPPSEVLAAFHRAGARRVGRANRSVAARSGVGCCLQRA